MAVAVRYIRTYSSVSLLSVSLGNNRDIQNGAPKMNGMEEHREEVMSADSVSDEMTPSTHIIRALFAQFISDNSKFSAMNDTVDMDFESKYGHLTKPLKEAAMCWDIDLKDVIDSFLAKENDESVTLDPNHMLNFAQAGMLISSTTTNYSRKVEHLYNLVYTTLDSLSKGEGKSLATSALIKKIRKRIVGFQECEAGFELLDPQFQQPVKGIDMAEGEGVITNGSNLVRRVPLLLLPREEGDRPKDVVPNAATGGKQSSNGTEFKTSNCSISKSGCLLLDPSFAVFEESDQILAGGRGSMGGRVSLNGPLIPGAAGPMTLPQLGDLISSPAPPIQVEFDHFSPVHAEPEFVSENEDEGVDATPESPMGLFPPLPEIGATPKRSVERPKRSLQASPESVYQPPAIDPWRELDPHAVPTTGRSIKMKVGKCYSTLPDLKAEAELRPFLDRSCSYQSKTDLFGVDSYLLGGEMGSQSLVRTSHKNFLNVFVSEVAMEIRELKKKAAHAAREKRKEELKKAELMMTSDEDEPESPRPRYSFASAPRHSFGSVGGGTEENGENISPKKSVSTGLVLVPVKTKEERQIQAERERTAMLERVLELSKKDYDDFMRKHMQSLSHVDAEEVSSSSQPLTSGASVMAAAGNSMQEKIPELYATIRKWQDNLEPLLEEQNARPVFDLDDYLVSIIDKLKISSEEPPNPVAAIADTEKSAINDFLRNAGLDTDMSDDESAALPPAGPSVSSFENLVRGEPKWNVCRLFLSTLILTNNGNVEIFGSETNDDIDVLPAASDTTPRASSSAPLATRTPPGATPLRGSQVFGASQSFQVKLKNADKNLKLAIQDNAAAVVGTIMTNVGLPPLEPIGEVPYAEDDESN